MSQRAGPDPPESAAGPGTDTGPADTGNTGGNGGAGADATARIAELEDQRLRALADLDNLRKACARQVSRAEAETRAQVARQWLPVVDNLELALKHAEADPGSIIEGVKAVREQAVSVLAQLGFARRDDLGTSFNPARHDAVAARPDPDAPEDSVVEVVRPAYGEGDSQLRPAQVIVARGE